MQQVMQQMQQAQDLSHAARGALMVTFLEQDLAKQTKLHRLLQHICEVQTYPGLLGLGNRSAWLPVGSKESIIPLLDMLQPGLPAETAIEQLAWSWHGAIMTIQARFCFKAALLDSLPGTFHTIRS